jgi:phage shock protein E
MRQRSRIQAWCCISTEAPFPMRSSRSSSRRATRARSSPGRANWEPTYGHSATGGGAALLTPGSAPCDRRSTPSPPKPNGAPTRTTANVQPARLPRRARQTSYRSRSTTIVSKQLLEQGAQPIEVLPEDEYVHEHLPGAINIPLKTLDAEGVRALARDRPVLAHCYDYQ